MRRGEPGPILSVDNLGRCAQVGVGIGRGGVTLDGVDLRMPTRVEALDADAKALLVMHTDPEVRYACFDQVLADVKRAGITRLGFARNDAVVE